MKRHIVRIFSAVLAATMLAASFAGCSGKTDKTTSKSTGAVTIRYARWGLPEEMNGTKKIIAAFEKSHPNINVSLENCSWDQYWEKMQTEIASNTQPDVMLMDGGWYLSQFAPKGVLSDIGPMMQKDNISKDDYYDVWKTFTYKDKIYAMPRDYNSIVMYYNKDLFKAAGITQYPTGEMTWDQVAQLAQKLTLDKNGKKPSDPGFDKNNIVQYGLLAPFDNVDSTIETMIWQKGGRLMSEDGTQCLAGSKESKEVFQFLYDLANTYCVSPTEAASLKYGEEAFPTGKFAMVYQGSWLQSSLTDAKFDWDIAVAPTFDKKIYCAQSVGNAILGSSANKDAAWEFVKYMSGKDGQKIMAESHDSIPVLKDVSENYYVNMSGKPENKKAIFEEAVSTVPYVDFPQKGKIFDAIKNIAPLYLNGKENLDTMTNTILSQVKSIQNSAG